MSWSFNGIGKPSALLARAREQLAAIKCVEPEESIKNKGLHIIEAVLLGSPESAAYKIEAYGSQTGAGDGKAYNTFSMKVEHIYGFVE